MKASTVEVMPEIPDTPEDEIAAKKNKKYLGKAIKSQASDKINRDGSPLTSYRRT